MRKLKVIPLLYFISIFAIISCQNTGSKTSIEDIEGTVWTYISDSEHKFTIEFKDGMILGKDGCNKFSMKFKTSENNKISIEPYISTEIACTFDYAITQTEFAKSSSYELKKDELWFNTNFGQTYKFKK